MLTNIHLGQPLDFSGRSERIRTSGPYVPNVVLYQAELHSVTGSGARLYAVSQPGTRKFDRCPGGQHHDMIYSYNRSASLQKDMV